jgi:hypothetical protein
VSERHTWGYPRSRRLRKKDQPDGCCGKAGKQRLL